MTKVFKVKDIAVDQDDLLSKGYGAIDLVGKTFIIEKVSFMKGEMGKYVICSIEGDDLEHDKFSTGAQNIVARLKAADEADMFPLQCTIVKKGNSFDIE